MEKKSIFIIKSLKGAGNGKSTFFKELTPRSRTYELGGQAGEKKKKHIQNQRQTNTSHSPTKTISKTVAYPLNRFT